MAPEISQRYPSARALADALEDLERAHLSGAPLPLARRETPESVGLPAAAPRERNGAVLGAGVAAAVLLPLLCLAVVWGWTRSALPATNDDVAVAAGQDPGATSTDAGPAADSTQGSKADLPRQLAQTLEAIETWDLKRAERELVALERRATTPATTHEVETLKALHAAAVASEGAEIEGVLETYTKDLRGYAALDAALDLLRTHPNSAPLGVEAARLHAVCGEIPRANEVLKGALRIDPSLTDVPRTQTLLELLSKNASLDPPSTAPEIWQRWRPYQGGVWSIDRGGALEASGHGLGEYGLAGLLAARQRPSSPPYRLQVEVALTSGERAYGGVLFGVSSVGEGYLAYLVREKSARTKYCTTAEAAQLEASGRKPLFLRVARLEGGEWTSLGTSLCVAEDRGEGEISFELEVRAQWVRATVGGILGQPVRLPAPVRAGEVGVLCFYGGPVTYRDFRSVP